MMPFIGVVGIVTARDVDAQVKFLFVLDYFFKIKLANNTIQT